MKNTANKSTEWYLDRIGYLSSFMTEERVRKFIGVAGRRTRWMTVCMENTFYSQNASALIRHCDAFGVQEIHAVEELCRFRPNTDVVRGSDQWITLRRHPSTAEALDTLRRENYRIVAATPHQGDTTPEDFDVEAGRFALLFGTELQGISDEAAAAADAFIRIPMCGFVESLNVSAAAAILIYMLSGKLRSGGAPWRIDEHEKAELLFRWMSLSVRDSRRVLERYEREA